METVLTMRIIYLFTLLLALGVEARRWWRMTERS
jgi:hypothetical protein